MAGEKKIKKPRRKSHFLFKILKALRNMEHEVEEKKAIFFYGFLGKQTENENGAEKRRGLSVSP